MKKAAREGQVKVVKVMALDLIRIRKHQDKFVGLQAQLRAISLQMQTMSSTHALTEGMKSAARAMRSLNAQLKLPALQKIMMDFARETEALEMKQEMIGDAVDDVMDTEEDIAESEEVVNQILDEIGITMNEGMVSVPSRPTAQTTTVKSSPVEQEQKDDEDIVNRLNNLGSR